jgi:hypothetical protein
LLSPLLPSTLFLSNPHHHRQGLALDILSPRFLISRCTVGFIDICSAWSQIARRFAIEGGFEVDLLIRYTPSLQTHGYQPAPPHPDAYTWEFPVAVDLLAETRCLCSASQIYRHRATVDSQYASGASYRP